MYFVYIDVVECTCFIVKKKAIVNLPIRIKANSKRTSGNSLVAQNKDMGSASQTLLTRLNYLCVAGYFLQSDSINVRMIA